MKRSIVFTIVTALALCVAQLSYAEKKGSEGKTNEANKKANEANKLAREGADAAKNQEFDKAIDLLRKAADLEHKYTDDLSAVYQQRAYAAAKEQNFPNAISDYSEGGLRQSFKDRSEEPGSAEPQETVGGKGSGQRAVHAHTSAERAAAQNPHSGRSQAITSRNERCFD